MNANIIWSKVGMIQTKNRNIQGVQKEVLLLTYFVDWIIIFSNKKIRIANSQERETINLQKLIVNNLTLRVKCYDKFFIEVVIYHGN